MVIKHSLYYVEEWENQHNEINFRDISQYMSLEQVIMKETHVLALSN